MIDAMILSRILYAHHIPDVLNHADGPVIARLVRTDRADILVGYHHTVTAVLHLIPEMIDRRREMMHVLLRLSEKMQGKTQRAPATYSREGTDRIHSLFEKLWRVVFLICHD